MIAVDTSALMAILLSEPEADTCASALESRGALLISAVTVAEALIVAARRNLGAEMQALIEGLGFEVISATAATARRVERLYQLWGKGRHPAALNFGDCFAYDVAEQHGCPLLYVGADFSQTDLVAAI